jgi:hypothetical protein
MMAKKAKRKVSHATAHDEDHDEADVQEEPVLDADGNPIIVTTGPGDPPDDDEEREIYTVGKGGLTARGKVYLEGEHIMLSETEADQITDMGNQVTAVDPVQAKATAERRAERDEKRRERHAAAHTEAQEAMAED